MARYISFAVLLAIIIVIGAVFYKVMIGFFVPVFLAVVLVVVFRPLHRWVCSKVRDRDPIAAGITTTLIVLIVLIPASLVLSMAAIQGASLFKNFNPASIKLGLSKFRSNSVLNLEFPFAKPVQEIQRKVDDIQVQLAKQQSYQDLVSEKGYLRSDVAEIGVLLDQLLPRLVDVTRDEVSRKIVQARLRNPPSPYHSDQFQAELKTAFEAAAEELQSILEKVATNPESIWDESELVTFNSTPQSGLSLGERVMVDEARRSLISNGMRWNSEIVDMRKRLDGFRTDETTNLAQLQRSVLALVSQWQKTRESIAGGPWMAALKDLANPSDEDVEALNTGFVDYIRPRLVSFTGDSAAFLLRFLVSGMILLVSLYFFLYDGPSMVRTLMELSPLDDTYELELLAQFDRISRAIVLAMVLSALMQGLAAGVGYYFAGMPSLILLTALTATCALVPFVGPAIVWVPVCLYLAIYEENLWAAGLLAVWGTLVVGTVDNLVKVFILHGQSQLHPLLALLSVLGGIQSLGPIGILIGPMVVVLLQTLLGILRKELILFKKVEDLAADTMDQGTPTKSLSGLIRKVKNNAIATGDPAAQPADPGSSSIGLTNTGSS